VSLARAAASNADVLLLDDPLSAVDNRVGNHIYEKLLSPRGFLRDRTRVLVTHGLQYLKEVDLVLVVSEGQIVEKGRYEELVNAGGVLSDLVEEFEKEDEENDHLNEMEEDHKIEEHQKQRNRLMSQMSSMSDQSAEQDPLVGDQGRLVEDEKVQEGKVRWGVYKDYARLCGSTKSLLIFLGFILGQVLHTSGGVVLSKWSDKNSDANQNVQPGLYMGLYGGLGCVEVLLCFVRQYIMYLCCMEAARMLHNKALKSVVRSPQAFFDVTPTGRITNRLASDLDEADQDIPQQITDALWCACELIATLILTSVITPIFLIPLTFLTAIFAFLVYYYIGASRQIKRLEAVGRYPNVTAKLHQLLMLTLQVSDSQSLG